MKQSQTLATDFGSLGFQSEIFRPLKCYILIWNYYTEKTHKNHQFLAYSKMGIAKIKIKQNQYQIAAELYQQAIIILTEIYSNESSELAQPKAALGQIYLRCGHTEKGKQFYQEAIDLLKQNFGDEYYLIRLYQNDLLTWNEIVRSRARGPTTNKDQLLIEKLTH